MVERSEVQPGLVYTFYSYKGGVGRSMALANVATLLSKADQKVLVVDWDLEAPGIERYFLHQKDETGREIRLSGTREDTPGMLDMIQAHRDGSSLAWSQCVIEAEIYANKPIVTIITAGRDTDDYAETVQRLDWSDLFENHDLGAWIHSLREEWKRRFDVILIDSRTGISDIGGICTILFPDALVLFFTTNEQSIRGVAEVTRRARAAQEQLPIDRDRLVALPVLSRDESQNEYERAQAWRERIADELEEFFEDWLVRGTTARNVLEKLYLPYVAYWSFGERLPVFERPTELEDPRKLGAAYVKLATLIEHRLDWTSLEAYSDTASRESVEMAKREAAVYAEKLTAYRSRVRSLALVILVVATGYAISFYFGRSVLESVGVGVVVGVVALGGLVVRR